MGKEHDLTPDGPEPEPEESSGLFILSDVVVNADPEVEITFNNQDDYQIIFFTDESFSIVLGSTINYLEPNLIRTEYGEGGEVINIYSTEMYEGDINESYPAIYFTHTYNSNEITKDTLELNTFKTVNSENYKLIYKSDTINGNIVTSRYEITSTSGSWSTTIALDQVLFYTNN